MAQPHLLHMQNLCSAFQMSCCPFHFILDLNPTTISAIRLPHYYLSEPLIRKLQPIQSASAVSTNLSPEVLQVLAVLGRLRMLCLIPKH